MTFTIDLSMPGLHFWATYLAIGLALTAGLLAAQVWVTARQARTAYARARALPPTWGETTARTIREASWWRVTAATVFWPVPAAGITVMVVALVLRGVIERVVGPEREREAS